MNLSSEAPGFLPPAPRKLHPEHIRKERRFGWWMIVAAVVVTALALALLGSKAATLVGEQRLRAAANARAPAQVEGRVSSQGLFIFHSYSLWAEFADEAGVRHRGRADFETMFVKADRSEPPVVYYVKGEPDDFVLSWAAESVVWRWLEWVMLGLTALGICALLQHVGRSSLRRVKLHARVAERGVERCCRVVSLEPVVINNKRNGETRCRYALPKGGEREFDYYPSATPILLAGQTELLVLMDPSHPEDVLVPTAQGAPLQLGDTERQWLAERIAQDQGPQ